jgi:DNA-binding HxlR family transcriptional regulator
MAAGAAMKRVPLDQPSRRRPVECPVEAWLAFLGHRWNALVLWHLQGGAKRHGELAALLPGIAPKVLSERLDGLEERGLISRSPIATFPRGVTYALTPRGNELVSILDRLELWSRRAVQSEARS